MASTNNQVIIELLLKGGSRVQKGLNKLMGQLSDLEKLSRLKGVGVGITKAGNAYDLTTRRLVNAVQVQGKFAVATAHQEAIEEHASRTLMKANAVRKRAIHLKKVDADHLTALKINAKLAADSISKGTQKNMRFLKGLQNMLLGVGLASLFAGMALKNAAQGAIKSFAKTFTEVTEGSTLYNQTLGRLSASFQFLKFSMMDAFLASSGGQNLIDMLIKIMDWFSALPDSVKNFIFWLIIIGLVVGAVAMIFGQIVLALLGPLSIVMFLYERLGLVKTVVDLIWKAIKLVAKPFLAILIIVLAVIAITKIWNSDMSLLSKIILTIIVVMITLLLLAMLFGISFSLPLLLVIALIAIVVALGIALVLAGDHMKLSFLKAIRAIGNFMYTQITKRLLFILDLAGRFSKTAKNMAAKIRGVGITFDTSMGDKIAALEAKIAAKQAEKAAGATDEKSIFDKAKSGMDEFKEGVTNNYTVDTVNITGGPAGDDLGDGIDEASQYNSSAGTG
jgi:hypothetical protein